MLEIGCGAEGGFIPRLSEAGYDAVGIDPEAPMGRQYRSLEFERYDVGQPVDAIVVCTALHHVDDLAEVVEKMAGSLAPEGVLVLIEWDWKRFDEATATWCFARLPALDSSEHTSLQHKRIEWTASGQPWGSYLKGWATRERLHAGQGMLDALDSHFERSVLAQAPYFFAELDEVSQSDEQAAIDHGDIQATGIHYVGRRASAAPAEGAP